MNIRESEILKLKTNMGFGNRLGDQNTSSMLVEKSNNNNLSESAINKYKPNKFTELLTEEDVNRKILTWMKSWDDVVFNKKFKIPEIQFFNFNNESSGNNLNNNQNQFKKEVEYVQSKNKIVLIAGPPGIGKTTLAKVLARHCGYEPLVVNASDERTSDKLLLRIYDTTQIHNLNFSNKNKTDKKPTCLILDEIDGVLDGVDGKNAIKNILDFIKYGKVNKNIVDKARKNIISTTMDKENLENNARNNNKLYNDYGNSKKNSNFNKDILSDGSDDEGNSFNPKRNFNRKTDKESDDEGNSSKINKNIIKRPIICICNDLYAKTLAPLRKEGLVFHLKRANPYKLLQRLKEICKIENLNIENNLLKNLCEKSNSDIRVCINSLQFISYNISNVALIKSLSSERLSILGCKDIAEGLFDIWMKLFTSFPGETPNFNTALNIYNNEYVKINDGIYVNYLKVPKTQTRAELVNRTKLLEYLSFSDTVTAKINEKHYYELSKFQALPGAFAKKKYFVTDYKLNLEFPILLNEYKTNKKINSRIISTIKETFEENNFHNHHSKISKKSLICDVLPYMFQLMQPNIREINTELMTKNEIKQLSIAINAMYNFGLKFKDKTMADEVFEEDISQNVYEPDIQRLLNFSCHNVSLSMNVNESHMNVSDSLSSFRMTPKQRLILKSEFERLKSLKENTKDIINNHNFSSLSNNASLGHLTTNDDNPVKEIKDKIGRFNFFEPMSKRIQSMNQIESNSSTLSKNATDKFNQNTSYSIEFGKKRNFSNLNDPDYKFVYKYNEGVTNTVRRTLNINYFFK